MSSAAHQLIAAANNAFSEAADQVEHVLGQALQLQLEDPKHLSIAMDMAKLMHEVFSKHAERVTILSPLVLSAGTELMNHMDKDKTALAILSSPPLLPKGVPCADNADERGQGIECGKHSWATNARSQSWLAQSKHQWQKSKAIITSDDDLELDEVVPTVPVCKEHAVNMIYKPGQLTKVVTEQKTCRSLWHSVVASDDDMDTNTATNTGPPPKMGVPYVELPPASTTSSDPQLKEDDFADTMAPSWAPCCGQCVARDLICHQAFNKDHGSKLRVCAFCSRLKIHCGGKGSEVPTVKGKSATSRRTCSQSHHNIATHVKPSVPDTATTAQNEDEVPTHPSTSIPPPPSASTDRDSVLAFQAEVATLRTAVAALEDQVVASDKWCEDANTRLAEQEARSALLTTRFDELLWKLLPAATSPTTECGTQATSELAAGKSLASDSTTEASSASADPAGEATGQSAAVPLTHTAESSSESAAGPANLVDDSLCSSASLAAE
ncbi:hypothetical protein F4604DRAFT_1931516 [Suillus subluteus]|nr:hypothetical protein F4604DRAFT_1931516 [Suillus subluteus]